MQQHYRDPLAALLNRQSNACALDRRLAHSGFLADRAGLWAEPKPSRAGAKGTPLPSITVDVTESSFQSAVIDRSQTVPVVVDFWAEWCGPCRQLGPVIERAVAARAGKIELAKVDVDASPSLSRTYRIQSIPAVKAFRDGKVAA